MISILSEIDKLQKEINSQRPFSEDLLKEIKEYYKIGLTYTSNAIEGNSLTETETKIVLEEGLTKKKTQRMPSSLDVGLAATNKNFL